MKAKSSRSKAASPARASKTPVKKAAPKAKAPKHTAKHAPRKGAKPAPVPVATATPSKVVPKRPVKPKPAARRKEWDLFRKALLKRKDELSQAYRVSKGDSRSHLDNGTEDYIDYAVNSYAKEFLLSLTELDRKQLLLVEEALRRIDRGEYGRCQQCGEEITRKRLDVAPWARHCVRCQELEEQGLLPQYPSYQGESDAEGETEDEKVGEDFEDGAEEEEVESEEAEALDDETLPVGHDEEEE